MKMKCLKPTSKGFSLIETLVACSVASVGFLLLQLYLSICLSITQLDSIQQYQLACIQLRLLLAPLSSYDIVDNSLSVDLRGEEVSLSLHNGRLVMTPGFVIYADDIDDLNFHKKSSCIYMDIRVKKQLHEMAIYCE